MATISTTARPAYVYDAVGDQWVPIAWRVFPAGVGSAPALTFTGDSDTGLWSPAADTVAFSTGGVERLRITSSGNVGIGTSSPVGNVDVYNATTTTLYVRGDGSVDTLLRRASANASSPGFYFQKARGTLASPTIVSAGDTAGQLFFQAHDGTAFRSLAVINGVVDTTPGASDMPGRLEFYTTADGASSGTERMRITSAGNVGIGTNSPGSLLEVSGGSITHSRVDSAITTYNMRRANTGPTAVVNGDNLADITMQGWDGAAYRVAARIRGAVDGGVSSADMPGRLMFYTTADGGVTENERMRIDSAGNVGIGTSSPVAKLQVDGSVRFGGNSNSQTFPASSAGGGVHIYWNQTNGNAETDLVNVYDNAGESFRFYQKTGASTASLVFVMGKDYHIAYTGGTERMRIDSAGNVGIGTSSPGRALDVASASSAPIRMTTASASSGVIEQLNSRGTLASPTATQAVDRIGGFIATAHDGTAYVVGGRIMVEANQNFSPTARGSRFTVQVTPDDSTTTTERMRVAGDGLITGSGTSLGAWTAYTPTLGGTGWAIGNGTATGAYCQVGKIIHFWLRITLGSTSTAGAGACTVTVPVAPTDGNRFALKGSLWDASASQRYAAQCDQSSGSEFAVRYISSASGLFASTTTNAPFTWATSDFIQIDGTYSA